MSRERHTPQAQSTRLATNAPNAREEHAIGTTHAPGARAARNRHSPRSELTTDTPHARSPTITGTHTGPSPKRSFPHNAPSAPDSTRRRRSTLPSFVYRQEVFELSIVASSIAHAREEAASGLPIPHKLTTWAKVGTHDAQRRAIKRRRAAMRSSPYQQKKVLLSSRRFQNRKPPGRDSTNSTRTTARA